MSRKAQGGFFFAYLLAVIGLLSTMTLFYSRDRQNLENGRRQAEVRLQVLGQFEAIRMKILDCVISYPTGDNGSGYRPPYPAAPDNGLVSALDCPGAPSGAKSLWSGKDGVFYPKKIRGLGDWRYAHDADSVRLSIEVLDATDLVAMAGVKRAAERSGEQAAVVGNVLTFEIVR